MRYGIPILGDRVAPRSTCADSVLVAVLRRNRARAESTAELADHSLLELAKVLTENRIDVLVCGGISREERDYLETRRIEVIDNVVGSTDELLAALQAGELQSGFGLKSTARNDSDQYPGHATSDEDHQIVAATDTGRPAKTTDCLACTDRVCMQGQPCEAAKSVHRVEVTDHDSCRMLEAALDVAFESERTLCRLSELIYFCLELRYQRIGLAYCVDLQEPTEILVRVLRRFFKVYPVCCKVGGRVMADSVTPPPTTPSQSTGHQVACNPAGQAEVLNRLDTDINVLVGLCMGADCLLTRMSDAPVTTLFVKDKSLANNPIGAVYSDYYLKEAIQAARGGSDTNV